MTRPNTNPIFAGQLELAEAVISVANAAFDGTGTFVEIANCPTTSPNGKLIRKLVAGAEVTTTTGMIKWALSDDGGTTLYMIPLWNMLVTAITPAAGVVPFSAQLDDQNDEQLAGGFILPAGWSIHAATHNAETFQIIVELGEL